MKDLLERKIEEHIQMFVEMKEDTDLALSIMNAANLILKSIKTGGALYLCGNGGSAADAQHIAAEFVSRFYHERKALHAEALTVNTSCLTAIGNDYSFDDVFSRQLEAKGRQGDTLLGLSTSGVSQNVINAIEYASKNGIHTIFLTGNKDRFYDNKVYEQVIRIPSGNIPRIQEAHIFIGHMIAEYVEREIVKENRK